MSAAKGTGFTRWESCASAKDAGFTRWETCVPAKDAGFTLVEVMAALLVFSIAIIGLTRASGQFVANAARLTDKTYAGVVADNALIRARFRAPVLGVQTGQDSAGGQAYDWQVETLATERAGMFEFIATVSKDDGKDKNWLITRRAYRSVQP